MEKYKLIHETEKARFYKLSKLSTYSENEKQKKPYQYVLVSDAKGHIREHIERLAFSFEFTEDSVENDLINNKKGSIRVDYMHICGYLTFMIHGGDIDSVYPDEWYLDKITEEV